MQHELFPQVAIGAAYFRRWFGNFTHTDALGVGPSDYSPYCVTAPTNERIGPLSGQPICGLFDVTTMRFARIFKMNRYRFQGMVDIYNVFNKSAVLSYNTTFSTAATSEWLRPTDVLQGRLVKIGGQLTF